MNDRTFVDFVSDQLNALPGFRAKRMFGGHGLYSDDRFFGIVMDGRLYFKTDDTTREDYVRRGLGPFIYEKARRTATIDYFEVPPEVLENGQELVSWARVAIRISTQKKK